MKHIVEDFLQNNIPLEENGLCALVMCTLLSTVLLCISFSLKKSKPSIKENVFLKEDTMQQQNTADFSGFESSIKYKSPTKQDMLNDQSSSTYTTPPVFNFKTTPGRSRKTIDARVSNLLARCDSVIKANTMAAQTTQELLKQL